MLCPRGHNTVNHLVECRHVGAEYVEADLAAINILGIHCIQNYPVTSGW